MTSKLCKYTPNRYVGGLLWSCKYWKERRYKCWRLICFLLSLIISGKIWRGRSLSPFNLELAKRGYEQALWKYYLLDVFHPLNSLEVKNTPQDLKLYKQLEGKIIKKREKPLPPADIPPGTMIATQKKPLVTQKIG